MTPGADPGWEAPGWARAPPGAGYNEPRGEGWSCHPRSEPKGRFLGLSVESMGERMFSTARPSLGQPPPNLRCHERGGGVGPRVASHPAPAASSSPALHVGALAPPPSARAPHADSPAGAGPGSGAERGPPPPGAERGEPGSRCGGLSRHLGLGRRPARRLFSSYGGCWVSSFAKSGFFFSSFWSFPSPPHLLPHPTPHIASALWILAVTSSH